MKLRTLLLLAVTSMHLTPTAAAMSDCERAMESLVILTRLALEHRQLERADVEYMIEDPQQLRNPYDSKARDPENLVLKQKLERNLPKVNAESLPLLRARILELIQKSKKNDELVADAKAQTAYILAPREIRFPALHGVEFGESRLEIHWHKTETGELRLAMYDPLKFVLRVFKMDRSVAPITHELENTRGRPERIGNTPGETKFLSLKNGNLVMAHLQANKHHILLHDADHSQIFELEASADAIYLARGPENELYLIAKGKEFISTYFIDAKTLSATRIHHIDSPDCAKFIHVMNSESGKIMLSYVDKDDHLVHFVDPVSKEERLYKSRDEVRNIHGMFLPGDHFVFAIQGVAHNPLRNRFAFIDSTTSEVRYTPYRVASENDGSFFRTSKGKVYLSVGVDREIPSTDRNRKYAHSILIFDALQQAKPKSWKNRLLMRDEPQDPVFNLDGGEGYIYKSAQWLETRSGRVILLQRSGEPEQMKIYEPEVKTDGPITTFQPYNRFASTPHTGDERVDLIPVSMPGEFFVQQYLGISAAKTTIYEALDSPKAATSIPYIPVLLSGVEKNGATYLVTREGSKYQVYQLTIGDSL